MLTVEVLRQSLPAAMKKDATQSLADAINNAAQDPDVAAMIRDNVISYTSVMADGAYRIGDYLSAVKYVSYKLMGDDNKTAWTKTFPDRFARLTAQGASGKEIAAHVAGYNKGKLVNAIMEKSLVPTWVLNQDMHQAALNVQYDLMHNANSEKVRSDAANSLLTHLKKPEGKIELDLNIKDSSGLNELKKAMTAMAERQQELLANGEDIKTITDARIIEHEPVEKTQENGQPEDPAEAVP